MIKHSGLLVVLLCIIACHTGSIRMSGNVSAWLMPMIYDNESSSCVISNIPPYYVKQWTTKLDKHGFMVRIEGDHYMELSAVLKSVYGGELQHSVARKWALYSNNCLHTSLQLYTDSNYTILVGLKRDAK